MPTLREIYREFTGDQAAHHKTIEAALSHQNSRRRRIVAHRMKGRSYGAIADALGISKATVRSCLLLTMRAIRKAIHKEPRYNQVGRRRRPDTTRARDAAHTPMVSTRGPATLFSFGIDQPAKK